MPARNETNLNIFVSPPMCDKIAGDPDFALHLTSQNFNIKPGKTSFITDTDSMVGAKAWVAAIEAAKKQILIASGHLRLRPVAEALIKKQKENPSMDIRVYLDQQEFISQAGAVAQDKKVKNCLDDAESEADEFNCLQKSFLWAREVDNAGVEVRFKTYAFRWHNSYAIQMHHKYMIIDGERLLTGSYNLSINSEHGTFENIMEFSGEPFKPLIQSYIKNFEAIWKTGEGKLLALQNTIKTANPIPLVFESIALTEPQVTALRQLIRDNCKQVDTPPFAQEPEKHKVCPRQGAGNSPPPDVADEEDEERRRGTEPTDDEN